MPTMIFGAVAALLLKAVFQLVKIRWPENYFDSSTRSTAWFTDSPFKVLLWRTVPFSLGGIVLVSIGIDVNLNNNILIPSYLFFHLLTTNVVTLFRAIAVGVGVGGQVLYFAVTSICLGFISVLMIVGGDYARQFFPSWENLMSGVWTAILVGVGLAAYNVATRSSPEVSDPVLEPSNLKTPIYYIAAICRCAYQDRVDPLLLLAIIEVEVQNRPSVARHAELFLCRIAPKCLRPLSLGIAQQPFSYLKNRRDFWSIKLRELDLRSIEILSSRLSGINPGDSQLVLGSFEVKAAANRINGSSEVINSVAETYRRLVDAEGALSEYVDLNPPDGDLDANSRKLDQELSMSDALTITSPWAVRFEDSVYVCFRVVGDQVEGVRLLVEDVVSGSIVRQWEFDNTNCDYSFGLYRIPAVGGGVVLMIDTADGSSLEFDTSLVYYEPPLRLVYSASSDLVSLGYSLNAEGVSLRRG